VSTTEEKKTADKPNPKAAAPAEKSVPRIDPNENGTAKVSLSVYFKQRKIPSDQAAGFNLYVKQKGIGSKTPKHWQQLQDIFNSRPI
jgi:hypothetical protein